MGNVFSADLIGLLFLFAFILFYSRISTFLGLAKQKFRLLTWEQVERGVLPDHVVAIFDAVAPQLAEFGFEYCGTQSTVPAEASDPRPHVFQDIYWCQVQQTIASVQLGLPLTGQMARVLFTTFSDDGAVLETVNREACFSFPSPPQETLQDGYCSDLNGQWLLHQAGRSTFAVSHAVLGEFDAVSALAKQRWEKLIHHLETQYVFVPMSVMPPMWRHTLKGAWQFSRHILKQLAAVKSQLWVPYANPITPTPQALCRAEMDASSASLALASEPWPATLKSALFMISLICFALIAGYAYGLHQAAALLLVLFIHEMGHLLAMRWFDYRNLSILFLPMLGAVATGHKPHASAWQESVVLFAGPLPGLLLATLLVLIPSEMVPAAWLDFTRSVALFAIVLNLFNLLPFGILDGGRLFELAVLGRFPYARVIFAALGCCVGVVFAIETKNMVFGFAMLLLLLGIPQQWRVARLVSELRPKHEPLDKSTILYRLADYFAVTRFGGLGVKEYVQRRRIAQFAYHRLLQEIAQLRLSLFVLVVQIAAFVLGLFLLTCLYYGLAPLMQQTTAQSMSEQTLNELYSQALHDQIAQIKRAYAEANSPEARKVILDREKSMLEPVWYAQQYKVVMEQLPADHADKLRLSVDEARAHSPELFLKRIEEVLARLAAIEAQVGLTDEQIYLQFDLYVHLVNLPGNHAAAHANGVAAIWHRLREQQNKEQLWMQASLAELRAVIAMRSGDTASAMMWMQRYRDDTQNLEPSRLEWGWFMLDAGQPREVLTEAQQQLAEQAKSSYSHTQPWQILAGWALLTLNQPQEADAYFLAALKAREQWLADRKPVIPWYVRVINTLSGKKIEVAKPTSLHEDSLDHLIALERYAPEAAMSYRLELQKEYSKPPQKKGPYGYWGQARKAAHERILKEMFAEK